MPANTNNPKPLLLLVDDDERFYKKMLILLDGKFNLAYLPSLDNFALEFEKIEKEYKSRIELLLLDLSFTREEKGEGLDFIRSSEGKAVIDKGIPIIVVTNYRPQDAIAEQLVRILPVQKCLYKANFDAEIWVQDIREILKQKSIQLYLNYADFDIHEVEIFRRQVIDNLKAIYRNKITIYERTPHHVLGGDIVSEKIQNHLSSSDIILHLLSTNLLAEKNPDRIVINIYEKTRQYAKNVPVLLKKCLWHELEILKDSVPMPKNRKFLFPNDDGVTDATTELKELIDSLK